MIQLINCIKCGNSIGTSQYDNYYYCEEHSSEYICLICYNAGQKKCPKCKNNLTFRDGAAWTQFYKDRKILF
jgi:phage FluMu protein Com